MLSSSILLGKLASSNACRKAFLLVLLTNIWEKSSLSNQGYKENNNQAGNALSQMT